MPVSLCWNAIVKNESGRIERAMQSLVGHISGAVIADTGSTDDTKSRIQAFCAQHNIPCVVVDVPFTDWSQARNGALIAADTLMAAGVVPKADYFLLMDADMELRVKDPTWLDGVQGKSYDMYQHAGPCEYLNRRLVQPGINARYLGVTHEYLDVETGGRIMADKAFFFDHADGANRPDKFKRDIMLLKRGLKAEPQNGRYMFYLANSYRDAGKFEKAIKWYERRIAAGGWDEEIWNSQLNIAECWLGLKDEAKFVYEALKAYRLRPTRVEPLYALAKFYRLKGESAPSVAFAEAGLQIPKPDDTLFVNDYAYAVGMGDEFSISAFYLPGKKEAGFAVCDHLLLRKSPYEVSRVMARNNLYHYLGGLKELCPSFDSTPLLWKPEEGWKAMNPSVTVHGNILTALIRTVNYDIVGGRYHIGGNYNLGNDNPIRTRTFLVDLDKDTYQGTTNWGEVALPEDWPTPPRFGAVLGMEDMRLFVVKNRLWTSATVRELRDDGNCEQVLSQINLNSQGFQCAGEWERMKCRGTEKNWMPIEHQKEPKFVYRLGELVDRHGDTTYKEELPIDVGHISGGSQLFAWPDGGYMAIVHEAALIPGTVCRHYWHRFAYWDKDLHFKRLSKPFFLHDRQIEFVAGACLHPGHTDKVVFSYGVKDCEARIGTVSVADVNKLLWFKS